MAISGEALDMAPHPLAFSTCLRGLHYRVPPDTYIQWQHWKGNSACN